MYPHVRGMSLVDVLVGVAITLAIFLALIGILRVTLALSVVAKAHVGATVLANAQIEYLRSLDYDAIGTDGGIPAGEVPQIATSSENGVQYEVRTNIVYVDDASDGVGVADENGAITDYKLAKVDVLFTVRSENYTVTLSTYITPPGIEESVSGGVLRVVVVNADGVPVTGASVQIINASTTPTINTTSYTDAQGVVTILGAPASTQYNIIVSKTGYSSAQTYARTGTNTSPNPGYLTISSGQTTTQTFAIDLLGHLSLSTWLPPSESLFYDSFTSEEYLVESATTTVASGAIVLDSSGGVYESSGFARSNTVTHESLTSWTEASTSISLPSGTSAYVQVVDDTGALIADGALVGNSTGFTSFPIDLSGIATSSYPALALRVTLSTSDTAVTPQIESWSITYAYGAVLVPNVSYTLTGNKTIGTDAQGDSIFKTIIADATDSVGVQTNDIEYDAYTVEVAGYDVVDACEAPLWEVAPSATTTTSLYVGDETSHSLLVVVRDGEGDVVSSASTTLSRSGFSSEKLTSDCGAVYFGNISEYNDYTVFVEKIGVGSSTYSNTSVSGQTYLQADIE